MQKFKIDLQVEPRIYKKLINIQYERGGRRAELAAHPPTHSKYGCLNPGIAHSCDALNIGSMVDHYVDHIYICFKLV
jgi:hypothetical protein